MKRCPWGESSEKMAHYHDTVWGVPEYDDRMLFRKLMLDINQAGLSWNTILNKMENFDAAYDDFDIETVAGYSEEKIQELLQDPGIIRNRLKVRAAVINAQQTLAIQQEFGSFRAYLWRFVEGAPIHHHFQREDEVPAKNEISDALTKDLKKRGFKFVGSTIVYAFMQATGMFNDHLVDCFRYEELTKA